MNKMLEGCRVLAEVGASLHWLKPRDKMPVAANWSTLPRKTIEDLESSYEDGCNIGIRLGEPSKTEAGYLHLIDLDIRSDEQASEAHRRLAELAPGYKSLPCVISGSGGESRHYYFFSSKPLRGTKLARSEGFSMVWDEKKGREVKKHHWEIELFGTGKQAVLPPSIHPDTGKPYRWERTLPVDEILLGVGPSVEITKPVTTSNLPAVNDDLLSLVLHGPLDLDEAEIDTYIEFLPDWWVEDRDEWLKLGAALHHQYRGKVEGFRKWCKWAKQSAKFDLDDSKRVWRSFKEQSGRPVTMRSIIDAAKENRVETTYDFADDDEDEDDILAELLDSEPKVEVALRQNSLPEDDGPEWKRKLDLTTEGLVKASLPNLTLILRNDERLKGMIAYNQFSNNIVIRKVPVQVAPKKHGSGVVNLSGPQWIVRNQRSGSGWEDINTHDLRTLLETKTSMKGWGLKVSDRDLNAAIVSAAHSRPFHPIIELLESLPQWDRRRRVERLWIDYLGAEGTPYHRKTAVLFMMAAVARVYEPGCKFDTAPFLEGVQGARKSTFIETLAMGFYGELSADFVDKKIYVEESDGKWILEIPELVGFDKHDISLLKSTMSRKSEQVRRPYDRFSKDIPRQNVMIGSTNDNEYLRDPTGGRRFWPIRCNKTKRDMIDIDMLTKNLDQLWAEALAMYREARSRYKYGDIPLYLDDAESMAEAEAIQESRLQETSGRILAGEIEMLLDEPIGAEFDDLSEDTPKVYRNSVCGLEIWTDVLGRTRESYDRRAQLEIAEAMKYVNRWSKSGGYERTKRFGKQRIYLRNEPI